MSFWLNLLIVVAVLIFLIVAYIFTRKTPKRYYKKAMRFHRLGELYFEEGDSELANDYYGEAESYRKKAREMENVA